MTKGFCFAIPNLPDPIFHPFRAKKAVELLNRLDGLTAIHPMPPKGTLLVFRDRTKAVLARNAIEDMGNKCGKHIMDCEISDDWQELNVLGPAEWTER